MHVLANDDHGDNPLGGTCEPTHTVVYEHETLSFSMGRVLKDVTLDKLYVH